MRTQLLVIAFLTSFFAMQIQGQSRTIINANSTEISDNLDLRIVASLFGDSRNLQDFERQLNDPKLRISNLDLNNDYRVDYLRVIESVENRTHLVIIQSVLDRDLYQDVATIELEKDRYNRIAVQVVGNTYMYGANYIYEPEYYTTPSIYASFWISDYRPYYSSWSWNYYPSYYYAWNPCATFRYIDNVNNCLQANYSYNSYNYVNHRRSTCAAGIYNTKCTNGYAKHHPESSFENRNSKANNRYELEQTRNSNYNYGNNRTRYSSAYSANSNDKNPTSNQNYYKEREKNWSDVNQPKTDNQNQYNQNRANYSRVSQQQTTEQKRNNSQNNELAYSSTPRRSNRNSEEYSPSKNPPSDATPSREYGRRF